MLSLAPSKVKVAVVGAGIYGSVISYKLSELGYYVDLYERKNDICTEATLVNQYRLHMGYHYPRSIETAVRCRENLAPFVAEFAPAIVKTTNQYYLLSKENSRSSRQSYLDFCKKSKLEINEVSEESVDILKTGTSDLILKVQEPRVSYLTLKDLLTKRLNTSKVNLLLNTNFNKKQLKDYDFVVIATYASINDLIEEKNIYQYELVEKPIVRLPIAYKNTGVVVVDGPFINFDPLPDTQLHVMGATLAAIHDIYIGTEPVFNVSAEKYINRGVIKNPKHTKVKEFLELGERYFKDFSKLEHIGSMYTIRCIFANKDETNERPITVTKVNPKLFTVLSGKITDCLDAADLIKSALETLL